ncbi:MAG: hypothetical protein ACRCT1_02135 [Microcoleaceae cyanobacterium]
MTTHCPKSTEATPLAPKRDRAASSGIVVPSVMKVLGNRAIF